MKAVLDPEKHQFVLGEDYSVNRVSTVTPCEEHTHGYVELVYTLSGHAVHSVNGIRYRLRKGDLLFVNYGCTHSVCPDPQTDYADLMLKPAFLNESLRDNENAFALLELEDFAEYASTIQKDRLWLHFSKHEQVQLESLISLTLAEQKNEQAGTLLMKRSALQMLLNLVFRKMAEQGSPRFALNQELLVYLRDNCHERLTEAALAEKCHYTNEHFSRGFKQYTGKTFTQYLQDCRIERAKQLLLTTNKPVEEIFLECGFSNRTAFFSQFSKAVGCTPLQYRKRSKLGTF